MSIDIKKPIDRDYLITNLEKFAGHELYEKIEVEETYTKVDSSTTGALLVVDDSIVTPGAGEVGISVVQPFISDIAVGDYVTHTTKHDEVVSKFAPREGTDESDPDSWWDGTSEEVTAYKNLIDDTKTSTVSLWSSEHTNDTIEDAKSILYKYIDTKIAQQATVSIKYVTTLPMNPQENVLYIYDNGTTNTIYLYDGTQWVNTGVDLSSINFSDYYKKDEIDTLLGDYAKESDAVLVSDLAQDLTSPSAITSISTLALSNALIGKVDVNQGSANVGKFLIVGSDGNVTLGVAGTSDIQVSPKANNAIETITTVGEEGIYVDKTNFQQVTIISATEPTTQTSGAVWMQEY